MKKKAFLEFEEYENINQIPSNFKPLLAKAKNALKKSYSPYSNFKVAAIAELENGKIISGANQENASYPVGICAERVVLATISSLNKVYKIKKMLIAYDSENHPNTIPISPCGMCRQALLEYQERTKSPFFLLLVSFNGKSILVNNCKDLLPFAFGEKNL